MKSSIIVFVLRDAVAKSQIDSYKEKQNNSPFQNSNQHEMKIRETLNTFIENRSKCRTYYFRFTLNLICRFQAINSIGLIVQERRTVV